LNEEKSTISPFAALSCDLRAGTAPAVKILTDYEGRAVRLTDERLAHILEHPEMAGMEGRIEETLAAPERVIESLGDPEARLYYRFYLGTRVGDKHLCVVVKMAQNDAFVLTAYLVGKPAGGKQLWPKSG
jgi:hypothetical protein